MVNIYVNNIPHLFLGMFPLNIMVTKAIKKKWKITSSDIPGDSVYKKAATMFVTLTFPKNIPKLLTIANGMADNIPNNNDFKVFFAPKSKYLSC